MHHRFWERGAEAYAKALKADYKARLAELKNKLVERFDPVHRAEIEEQISKLKADYKAKCRAAARNIH